MYIPKEKLIELAKRQGGGGVSWITIVVLVAVSYLILSCCVHGVCFTDDDINNAVDENRNNNNGNRNANNRANNNNNARNTNSSSNQQSNRAQPVSPPPTYRP
ncbi:hypothetical protein DFJ63DRAFT_312150 [Scheffersomyces coipomensis]|uniref:uncharacterized protein n=1 Tax=Scheffersomyces coipomensis TaxID=1788519 RepID=UPI00315DE5C2